MQETSLVALRKKEGRGTLLTFILILQALFVLFMLVVLYIPGLPSFLSGKYSIVLLMLSLAIILLLITSAIGIWKWSKLGVYALGTLFFVWLGSYYFYDLPSMLNSPLNKGIPIWQLIIQSLGGYLFGSIVYFWAIKRKWHLFS